MIPYLQLPSLPLGPFTLEPFGIFVALGVWVASRLAMREAKREGLSPTPILDFSFWALLSGVVVAHWVHLFFYHPEELARYGPLQILRVWDGLSSTGGALGGVIAAAIFFKRRRVSFWAYSDALALGTAVGWGIARVGCAAVHDHPGVRTRFFFAVAFPDGPRHDLGLDDALLLFSISALIWLCRSRGWLKGVRLALLALLYGAGRFGLDFLRARYPDVPYADARYAGLTPAQIACVALVLYGLVVLAQRAVRPSSKR